MHPRFNFIAEKSRRPVVTRTKVSCQKSTFLAFQIAKHSNSCERNVAEKALGMKLNFKDTPVGHVHTEKYFDKARAEYRISNFAKTIRVSLFTYVGIDWHISDTVKFRK